MSSKKVGYMEILQDILEFSNGRRMLTVKEVSAYTGLTDYRAIKRKFPFQDNYIAAPVLAMHLAGSAGGDLR